MPIRIIRQFKILICLVLCSIYASQVFAANVLEQVQLLPCNRTSGPVCASTNRTFASECDAYKAGIDILYKAPCIKKVGCPVLCLRPEPVCGADSMTYWCGASSAACANTEVAYEGLCVSDRTGGSHRPQAWDSLLLVHLVWLVLAGLVVVGGLV